MPCTPPQGLRYLQSEVKLNPEGERDERREERREEKSGERRREERRTEMRIN